MYRDILKLLALPPASLLVGFLLAALLMGRWPRLGRSLLWGFLALFYLISTPFVAGELMAPLQPYHALRLDEPDPDAQAIVVLGAGSYFSAPEYWRSDAPPYGVDQPGRLSLQRLQYAAHLAKALNLPLLVSGGSAAVEIERSVARTMKRTLEEDFQVPVRWIEERSHNTYSNAQFSAPILQAEGIRRVYLVTHAWHMPRAVFAFEKAGLEVVPAPTRFVSRATPQWTDFRPSARAFIISYYAIHEGLGLVWSRWYY